MPRNLVVPGNAHSLDHNAYGANAGYRQQAYDDPTMRYGSLAEWQRATGSDGASTEAEGGACKLLDPPNRR